MAGRRAADGRISMRRPPATTALAASALVMLTLSAAASSAPKPRRAACEATPGSGTTLVTSKPLSIRVRVGLPTDIDMRDVPKIPDSAPSTGTPAEMPSPGIARAKKLKAGPATCIPQSAPTLPGLPTLR
jgi:hypothetical protein